MEMGLVWGTQLYLRAPGKGPAAPGLNCFLINQNQNKTNKAFGLLTSHTTHS